MFIKNIMLPYIDIYEYLYAIHTICILSVLVLKNYVLVSSTK